jgi:hypothetical protein
MVNFLQSVLVVSLAGAGVIGLVLLVVLVVARIKRWRRD